MAINPGPAEMDRFIADDTGGPVVMVNLLRFTEGGRADYVKFTRTLSMRLLARYGGEVLYAGDGSTRLVAVPDQDWDVVLIVRYPDRETFRRMVEDPDFRGLAEVRERTLTASVLQATVPWQ